jgi:hypothetical protein
MVSYRMGDFANKLRDLGRGIFNRKEFCIEDSLFSTRTVR